MAAPITLYHCLHKEPYGDALLPLSKRTVNGRENHFLFATPYLTKALAFAFSYHDGEIICNGGMPETGDEFTILVNSAKVLNKPRHTRVYAFSNETFEEAIDYDRQHVSIKPMLFKHTTLVFESRGINPLMQAGLQIFSTTKSWEELGRQKFFEKTKMHNSTNEEWLHNLCNIGFKWENNQRNINPNPKFKQTFASLKF